MKRVTLGILMDDNLMMKSVTIDYNDTGAANDSKLVKAMAIALLKGVIANADDLQVQDLLNELGIEKEKSDDSR